MRRFRVNVNGNEYDITVEELDVSAVKSAPKAASAAAPAGGEAVKSPMPGTILKVNVNNGDMVKKGQVLMILEAMKMENEIMCPCDGKVSVNVSNGATVESGTLLCTIA